jgi:predicted phage terminase large subunit-like protein
MKISKKEYQAFLRKDFVAFVQRGFRELNPQTEYQHNWHIEAIAEALEQCRTGKLRRLIINVPPRSLKSHMTSISFVAWLLGHDSSAQVICASYAQDLADKLAGDCRSLMTSKWYQELFPTTRLATRRQAVHDFVTTKKGSRLATSVGGVLTGRGANYIIIDDPLKPDEALSETQRNAVNSWYDHTLISRLNDKRTGCIILIMQRLHEDDLVGHVLQQPDWRVLKFPAIAEQDETTIVQTPYGTRTFARRAGEPLDPQREPIEVLDALRESLGEYNFSGQYQQGPAPLGGGMIKTSWFKTYEPGELPKEFDLVFQSWDTANKSSELSDYSACTTWGMQNQHLFLLNVLRKRLDYPELRRIVKQHAAIFEAKNILIEDKASGTQLIQDLLNDGVQETARYQPKNASDKIMRMHSVSSTIENGFVHIPTHAEWLAQYLHEMATFPKGKFDDQVDSTSQALDWVKGGLHQYGLFDWYRRAAKGLPMPSQANGKTVLPPQTRRTVEIGPGLPSSLADQAKVPVTFNPQAEGPCSECGSTCVVFCSAQLRCNSCGHMWWPNGEAPEVARVTRADVLARRF